MMNVDEMWEVLKQVYVPDFQFDIQYTNVKDRKPIITLRGVYREGDIVTGDIKDQHTRKWLLSEHMVKSELIQTAFKCYLTSLEHRAREHFLYRGRRIFGPHFDVDSLWEICKLENLDFRDKEKV